MRGVTSKKNKVDIQIIIVHLFFVLQKNVWLGKGTGVNPRRIRYGLDILLDSCLYKLS